MVNELLAERTNMLAQFDSRVAAVTRSNAMLSAKLDAKAAEVDRLQHQLAVKARAAAAAADQWISPKMRRALWLFGGGTVALFLAAIIGMSVAGLPAGPLFGRLVGTLLGWIIKAIPGALNGAGVVAAGAYHQVQGALTSTVKAVQDIRMQAAKDGTLPQVDSKLAARLDDHYDVIEQVKRDAAIPSVKLVQG